MVSLVTRSHPCAGAGTCSWLHVNGHRNQLRRSGFATKRDAHWRYRTRISAAATGQAPVRGGSRRRISALWCSLCVGELGWVHFTVLPRQVTVPHAGTDPRSPDWKDCEHLVVAAAAV